MISRGFFKKLKSLKTKGADLSTDEDLSIAVMNLISLKNTFSLQEIKPNKINILGFWSKSVNCKELLAKLMPKTRARLGVSQNIFSPSLCVLCSWHTKTRDKKIF